MLLLLVAEFAESLRKLSDIMTGSLPQSVRCIHYTSVCVIFIESMKVICSLQSWMRAMINQFEKNSGFEQTDRQRDTEGTLQQCHLNQHLTKYHLSLSSS